MADEFVTPPADLASSPGLSDTAAEDIAVAAATTGAEVARDGEPNEPFMAGAITGYDTGTSRCDVQLDGGLGTGPFQNITGRPFRVGQRVLVAFKEPRGGYVIGGLGESDTPLVDMQHFGAQAVGYGATSVISFGATVDKWGMASGSAIVAPVTGAYVIAGDVNVQADPDLTYLSLELWHSAAAIIARQSTVADSGDETRLCVAKVRRMNGGDSVTLRMFQTGVDGNARNVIGGSFAMTWTGW